MAVLLIFLRMLTFFIIVPVFFPNGTPTIMKIFLAGVIAFILVPLVNVTNIGSMNSNYDLIMSTGSEVINGLILGYMTNLVFMIIRMAGQLIDTQMGLSMISMFDPNANSNVTLIEKILYWTSLVLFFIVDGHHMLIKVMIESFDVVHLGKTILGDGTIMLIFNDFIKLFSLGVKISIPIVLIVLLTDITMGLVARTVPALNVMIIGLPIKILVGLACFSLALPMIAGTIVQIFGMLPDIYKGLLHSAPVLFVLASGEKTEEATPKKKREAKKKGQVAKSKEVPLAATLFTALLLFVSIGGYIGTNLMSSTSYFLSANMKQDFSYGSILKIIYTIMVRSSLIILPIVVPIMLMGVLGNFIQTGVMLSGEGLTPKLSKLNPLSGFKKMFSMKTVVNTIKDMAIVSVVGYIGYSYVKGQYSYILSMGFLNLIDIPSAFSSIAIGILFRVSLFMVLIAIIDYVYQRYNFNKDLKMSKQEVKEEYRQEEGDPQIKSKIRQKQREMSAQRMMQAVPEATVIVTNPTHIAIALRYEDGKDEAPKVIAKGTGFVAIKIKEIGKEHDIPIIENKPLARLIFEEVEIEAPIPVNMYQAVAEILAIIYKLKKKKRN